MALLQTSLIWVVYAIAIAVLIAVASVFIYVYQTPRDRSPSVTLTCIFAITTLLATVLLLPVDVALVSSTNSSALGRRKDWATDHEVNKILFSLKVVYYLLYSLDALLCLLVIPFTYFWYEEYDEVAAEEGEQTTAKRFWSAFRYTITFIAIVIVLFLVGFFVPVAKDNHSGGLDYFKKLLTENRKSFAVVENKARANPFSRRRTRPYLCPWLADNNRSVSIRPVHLHWPGPPSRQPDQDSATDFSSKSESNDRYAARLQPGAPAPTGRPLWRKHGAIVVQRSPRVGHACPGRTDPYPTTAPSRRSARGRPQLAYESMVENRSYLPPLQVTGRHHSIYRCPGYMGIYAVDSH